MIKLYYHGSSENHGCEAIIRSTNKILNTDIKVFSMKPEGDYKYNINDIMKVCEDKVEDITGIKRVFASIYYKLTNKTLYYTAIRRKGLLENIESGDICLSVGGDNYCYVGQETLMDINTLIRKKGAKTVLWGCSIEESMINDDLKKDLTGYSLIVARESLSYNFLKTINKNTVLLPDPAFQLDKVELPLPEKFIEGNTIGINVSPLIIGCENSNGITIKNYKKLIEWILENTDCNIVLIPHVVIDNNDDREPLKLLYDMYKYSNRIILIGDHNCEEIKGYISRCRFFIGARTHATIAAYSTKVPTLVVGYSVKAKGIAQDIFGAYDNYVVPVQNLKDENDLSNTFKWIYDNELKIKNHLEEMMDDYKSKSLLMKNEIDKLDGRD